MQTKKALVHAALARWCCKMSHLTGWYTFGSIQTYQYYNEQTSVLIHPLLQRHLVNTACTRAFFVCVVRKKLLLEYEFPTQLMFMYPALLGETAAYFFSIVAYFFFYCCIHFFLLLHKFLYCCYLFFIVACLFLLLVIFFHCCKPKIIVAIEKLSLHASGRFGPPYV